MDMNSINQQHSRGEEAPLAAKLADVENQASVITALHLELQEINASIRFLDEVKRPIAKLLFGDEHRAESAIHTAIQALEKRREQLAQQLCLTREEPTEQGR